MNENTATQAVFESQDAICLVGRDERNAWNSTYVFIHDFLLGPDLEEEPRCPLALPVFKVSELARDRNSLSLFVSLFSFPSFSFFARTIAQKNKRFSSGALQHSKVPG